VDIDGKWGNKGEVKENVMILKNKKCVLIKALLFAIAAFSICFFVATFPVKASTDEELDELIGVYEGANKSGETFMIFKNGSKYQAVRFDPKSRIICTQNNISPNLRR
jgi:hypothetical protein